MQVIPALGAGGAEQGCIDIAAEIVHAGARALVASNGGDRVHELERSGAVHIRLPVHSKNPFTIWRNIRRLKSVIQKYNVDIVHVRSRAPAWSCYYSCKKTDAKFMTTCHAPYNIGGKFKRFYNSIIARGDRVIAISDHVANYLKENYTISLRNIRLIHRGIALKKFHPTTVTPERLIALSKSWRIPDGASIIMLPGRLTRWKGHHILIDAVGRLERKDIFCVIIGADQGRTEYRQELETRSVLSITVTICRRLICFLLLLFRHQPTRKDSAAFPLKHKLWVARSSQPITAAHRKQLFAVKQDG